MRIMTLAEHCVHEPMLPCNYKNQLTTELNYKVFVTKMQLSNLI